jgi:predicted phosphodiesterase
MTVLAIENAQTDNNLSARLIRSFVAGNFDFEQRKEMMPKEIICSLNFTA